MRKEKKEKIKDRKRKLVLRSFPSLPVRRLWSEGCSGPGRSGRTRTPKTHVGSRKLDRRHRVQAAVSE